MCLPTSKRRFPKKRKNCNKKFSNFLNRKRSRFKINYAKMYIFNSSVITGHGNGKT